MTVRLLTTEEVAARFRTSPATVRYWRHVGIGPSGVKVGRRVLYDEAECDRWWATKVAASLHSTRPPALTVEVRKRRTLGATVSVHGRAGTPA